MESETSENKVGLNTLEILPRAKRRRWSKVEKQRVLAAVDACPRGDVGLLLRREGVYTSQLQVWRRELATTEQHSEAPTMKVPSSKQSKRYVDGTNTSASDRSLRAEFETLKAAYAELQKRNGYLHEIIDIQKKVAAMCEHVQSRTESD